jgi:hypothetical protein
MTLTWFRIIGVDKLGGCRFSAEAAGRDGSVAGERP